MGRKIVFRKRECPVCGERVTTNGLGRKSHVDACAVKQWQATVDAFGGLQVGDVIRPTTSWLKGRELRIVRHSRRGYGATANDVKDAPDDHSCWYGISAEILRHAQLVSRVGAP